MGDAIAIISKPVFEKLAGGEPRLGIEHRIERYDSTHKGLDTLADHGVLYLVTVRPGDVLWLVAALGGLTRDDRGWTAISNHCATVDLTPVKHLLDVTRDVAPGKLAMSLQTPRALTPHDARLLVHAANEAHTKSTRRKVFNVTFPKWLLEDAQQAGAPTPKPAKKKPAPAKPAKKKTRTTLAEILVEGALAQIEEVAGTAKPAKLLVEPKRKQGLRGAFTETVQSVFGGSELGEARRLLSEELAPFVDGPALGLALAEVGDDVPSDLVDQFAIKAIDDLARALVALALERPDDVPATCARFRDELAGHVDQVRELLEL